MFQNQVVNVVEARALAIFQSSKKLTCEICGKKMGRRAFAKAQNLKEDLGLGNYCMGSYDDIICCDCARNERDNLADFEGDYNDFHPEETEEEFSDHEDYELDF